MKNFGYLICLLLLWMVFSIRAESHYYKRSYYSPAPPTRYHHNNGFLPMTYTGDLHSAESKHKEASHKAYSKKVPYRTIDSDEDDTSNERYTSDEYSNEAHSYISKENDSREYTIGTQIRVQHPVPKKTTSSHPKYAKYTGHSSPQSYKGTSYSDFNLSAESPEPPPKKHHSQKYTHVYEPDPFHLVPPPKSTSASKVVTGYDVYETDQEDYEPPTPPNSRTKSRDRFKGVASKKQIEKYLEDQQKMLDEALKLQLLSDPKFEQFLKATKEKERIESEQYELDSSSGPNGPPPFRPNFNENSPPPFKSNRSRRRPQSGDLKRPPKGKHPKRRYRSAIVFNV